MAQHNDLEKIYDILTERQKSIISTYNGPEEGVDFNYLFDDFLDSYQERVRHPQKLTGSRPLVAAVSLVDKSEGVDFIYITVEFPSIEYPSNIKSYKYKLDELKSYIRDKKITSIL